MPQLSMLEDRPHHEGVRVNLTWDPEAAGGGAHVAMVQVMDRTQAWRTLWVCTLYGVMMDLLPTLVTDVYAAYAWGEQRDVLRAAAGVGKAMREHARAHEF